MFSFCLPFGLSLYSLLSLFQFCISLHLSERQFCLSLSPSDIFSTSFLPSYLSSFSLAFLSVSFSSFSVHSFSHRAHLFLCLSVTSGFSLFRSIALSVFVFLLLFQSSLCIRCISPLYSLHQTVFFNPFLDLSGSLSVCFFVLLSPPQPGSRRFVPPS